MNRNFENSKITKVFVVENLTELFLVENLSELYFSRKRRCNRFDRLSVLVETMRPVLQMRPANRSMRSL